ncbi:conserved hypothetical protein, conserved [Trypanosoma brucei gambiense DAL972]|uniref:RING-type domain-containing protein n=2 Tax=Trypanosoma brucei TaxID=5691 RepID=C9ZPQ3_TRYB9|nr:conserved hypothetical protein, conserved [Trypanosoma brucei gambiense DAL972]RHW72350.1 Anaphase-promoting complex subunit 11 RING-H2 finger/RING-H2 zinc finger containing protein [Trypanosoma brucei equiperdum]CBH11381.1 conserved hypothetical protein, conserved [Trypanosoma brucei gambiense DAL972]|eukprot:XP_011773668.1 conserved hypothetical protein, conserved [Trypanosoma brucei gambiense DAL972]
MSNTNSSGCMDVSIPVTLRGAVLFCTHEHSELQSILCLICRAHLADHCVHCSTSSGFSLPTSDCLVVKGECGHKFHAHCIGDWGEQHQVCPACRKQWVAAERIARS